MTFLGMSYVEIFVVALVAFVFLGPERMVDAAKKLGKVIGEVRRMAAELPSIDDLDLEGSQSAPTQARGGSSRTAGQEVSSPPDDVPDEDGPVAFKAGEAVPKPDKREEQASEDKA